MQLQRKCELVPALPAILCQQSRTGDEIGERRCVCGRSLSLLAGDQIELGELLTFVSRSDQRLTAVELIDDFEDSLLPLRRWRVRRQQPADPQVVGGPQCFRDQ